MNAVNVIKTMKTAGRCSAGLCGRQLGKNARKCRFYKQKSPLAQWIFAEAAIILIAIKNPTVIKIRLEIDSAAALAASKAAQ